MPSDTARTIVASTTEAIARAYRTLSQDGGGTIAVRNGDRPIEIDLEHGGRDHVRIVSEGSGTRTEVHRISFEDVRNVTVSGFEVSSTGIARPRWHKDLMVTDSRAIIVEDTVFSSNAVGRYGPREIGTVLGESLGLVRGSEDFIFRGNDIDAYYHGLSVRETVKVSIADNTFAGLQGDGLRLSGIQNVRIADNYMHDFAGTTNNFNHNDFIQVWSSNTRLLTRDLTIEGNVLDSGDGSSAQGIFIGNERFNKGERSHVYEGIEIFDNLIHSGNANGISVAGARGVRVTDNTLLWNRGAETIGDTGDAGVSRAPVVRLDHVRDGAVRDNITPGLNFDRGVAESGNRIVTYASPNDPGYVGTHFINAAAGGATDANDLRLRPDSDWSGAAGGKHARALDASDGGILVAFTATVDHRNIYSYTFDASASVDERGFLDADDYRFVWTLEDGTVLDGLTASHVFARAGRYDVHLDILQGGRTVESEDREIEVLSKTFLDLALGRGVRDASSYGSEVSADGARAQSGGGYRIGGDDRIVVGRENLQLHDLDSFGIALDLRVLGGDYGRFLLLHQVLDARVQTNGAVRFTLETDRGTFEVDSGRLAIDDGAYHRLGFDYDGSTLRLHVDGRIVDETAARGTTAPPGAQDLVLGSKWSSGLDAVVRDVRIAADAGTAGLRGDAGTAPPPVREIVDDGGLRAPLAPGDAIDPSGLGTLLVRTGFEAGGGAALDGYRAGSVVSVRGDSEYRIVDGRSVGLDVETDGLHELEAFALEFDMTAAPGDLSGTLAYFHKVLEVSVTSAGLLRFALETDGGAFAVATSAQPLLDGGTHRLGISYDADAGRMALQIDGEIAAAGAARGITAEATYYGLDLGHTWNHGNHDTFEMDVDRLVLSTRAAAGSDADAPVPEAGLIVPETPGFDDFL